MHVSCMTCYKFYLRLTLRSPLRALSYCPHANINYWKQNKYILSLVNEKQALPIASAKGSHVNAFNQWQKVSRNLTLRLRRKVAKNKALPRHVVPPPPDGGSSQQPCFYE
jgi:hypothetical protein